MSVLLNMRSGSIPERKALSACLGYVVGRGRTWLSWAETWLLEQHDCLRDEWARYRHPLESFTGPWDVHRPAYLQSKRSDKEKEEKYESFKAFLNAEEAWNIIEHSCTVFKHIDRAEMVLLVCAHEFWSKENGVKFDMIDFQRSLLSIADTEAARTVLRGFYMSQFGLNVDLTTAQLDGTFPEVSFGQMFGLEIISCTFRTALMHGMGVVKIGKQITVNWLWDMAEKAFFACLGSYYDTLKRTAGWISDVWVKMKEWGNDVIKQSASWFTGFQECLVMGLGMVGISAVLVLIEKFMVASGIISGSIKLGETFMTCYIAYIGLREGGSLLKADTCGLVGGLIGACRNVVKAVTVSINAEGVDMTGDSNGQFSPLSYLEVFARSLQSFSSDKVVQTGRFFNAFSQIKSGLGAVWECVEKICEFLWNLLDKGFGIKSRALADLSVMLGKDVHGWLRKCDSACDHMCRFPTLSCDILKQFKVLQAQGQDIRQALMSRSEKGSIAALTSVGRALEKLQQLLNSAILAGSAGPRYEPLWLAFVGKAGVGKSTAVSLLSSRYLAENQLDIGDCYARNTTDPFWSGYRRQAVVTYDDLGALTNGSTICEEAELIKLVSRDALPLNMASLEEKGMYFDSSLIVTSSNFMNYSPMAVIHDAAAYQRRRSLLVEIVEKEGFTRDPESPVAHQSYILRTSMEPFDQIETFESFEDLFAHFLNVKRRHDEVQRKILSAMDVPGRSFPQTMQTAASFLACLRPVTPISIQAYIHAIYPDFMMIACYDGVLYLTNEHFEFRIVRDFEDDVDAIDLKRAHDDALTVSMRYLDLLRKLPNLSPNAAHYMSLLVEKQVYTCDMKIRRHLFGEDEELYIAADSLAEWQRAYVYVMSQTVSLNQRGIFSSFYETMCVSLQKLYLADVRQWPLSVKFGLGVMAMLIFGGSVFKTLQYLGNFGGAAFSFAAVRAFSGGQSDDEVHKKTAEYRHRNNPVRSRHWSKGQADIGISYGWLMTNCLANLRFGHLDCQVVMLPGKRLVGVHHFLRRIPNNVLVEISLENQLYHVCWHAEKLQACDDSELSVYSHPTLRDISHTVLDRLQFGLEHLPDTFPALMASCKFDEFENQFVSEVAPLTVEKRNRSLTVYCGEYQRFVPACLEYQVPTVNKDCGSLIIANVRGVDKIVGIHVAGTGKKGQACFLPSCLDVALGQNWFENDFVEYKHYDHHGNGTFVVGALKEEKRFFTQQKTAYTATPSEWHLDSECGKEPAILTKFDPRLVGKHEGYDPYTQGMAKYEQECGPFDEEGLSEVCGEIGETWFDACDGFNFSETTLADAINGVPGVDYMDPLVMNTSEGYPYILSRNHNKGKSRFLVEENGVLIPNPELQKGIDRIEEESKLGIVTLVGVECAKDEKLPKKKIYEKPKTRLFTVLPMDYNIVVRRKFFPFVRFLMKKRDVLPCQVGLNPYGREWGRIANTLLSKGNDVLCCDYSRFDGILPKSVMFHIAGMINRLMGGSDELQTQRINLLMACCGRYGICSGRVWRVENGIPSGFPLTVIINSIFNEVIVRYLYWTVFVNDKLMKASFGRYISMVVYGDDNLISVSPTISAKFNGHVVQTLAKNLGITITDGVDKYKEFLEFRPLTEVDFLKRKFVRDAQGLWRAPMELESLWSQLHWVKTKFLGLHEAYLVNLESVLRELYLHDPGLTLQYRQLALQIDWVQAHHVPTMKQIEAFHAMQIYEEKEFSCYAYDALLTPTSLGPIGAVKTDVRFFQFKNLAAAVSGHYRYEVGDYVVCLKVASKYGDDGCSLDFNVISGRGELPTAEWLRAHLLRKGSEMCKRLSSLYKGGRRLVFLGRNDNIAPVVFMVLFGLVLDVIKVDESNIILTKAMSVASSLGYIVDAFPEAFVSKDKKGTAYAALKSWKVFGAGECEMSLIRRFSRVKCFERRLEAVPHFEDPKETICYVRELAPVGLVVESYLHISDFGGLPGFQWQKWVKMARGQSYSCSFGFRVCLFDNQHVEVFDEKIDAILLPGTNFNKALIYEGKPLDLYSFEDKEMFHPLSQIMRMLSEKLQEGVLG